jgi:hypothetical protein
MTVSGPLRAADLVAIRSRLAAEISKAGALAAVLDARLVRVRLSSSQWQAFILANTGAEVPPRMPVAFVVPLQYLAAGDAYSMLWARAGRLRCFFSEPEDAFSWVAWRLTRPLIVPASVRRLPGP